MSRRDLAQRYWDAYAATLEPTPGSAVRNLARIERRIDASEAVDDEPPTAAEQPRRAAAAGVVLLGKSAAISVGIATATLLSIKLAVVGWTQLTGGAPASAEPPAAHPGLAAREQAAAPTPAAPPAAAEPELAAPTTPVASDAPRPAEPSRRGPAPAAVSDRLRAEVALMDRTRAALERDDAEALLRLTSEHARRFPDGALVEEREAWQAIAACRLGHARAAARADAFLAAHPRSAQADKLRRACEAAMQKR